MAVRTHSLKAFADSGGEAVEVVCAAHHPPEWGSTPLWREIQPARLNRQRFPQSERKPRPVRRLCARLSPTLKPVWHDWPVEVLMPNRHSVLGL